LGGEEFDLLWMIRAFGPQAPKRRWTGKWGGLRASIGRDGVGWFLWVLAAERRRRKEEGRKRNSDCGYGSRAFSPVTVCFYRGLRIGGKARKSQIRHVFCVVFLAIPW